MFQDVHPADAPSEPAKQPEREKRRVGGRTNVVSVGPSSSSPHIRIPALANNSPVPSPVPTPPMGMSPYQHPLDGEHEQQQLHSLQQESVGGRPPLAPSTAASVATQRTDGLVESRCGSESSLHEEEELCTATSLNSTENDDMTCKLSTVLDQASHLQLEAQRRQREDARRDAVKELCLQRERLRFEIKEVQKMHRRVLRKYQEQLSRIRDQRLSHPPSRSPSVDSSLCDEDCGSTQDSASAITEDLESVDVLMDKAAALEMERDDVDRQVRAKREKLELETVQETRQKEELSALNAECDGHVASLRREKRESAQHKLHTVIALKQLLRTNQLHRKAFELPFEPPVLGLYDNDDNGDDDSSLYPREKALQKHPLFSVRPMRPTPPPTITPTVVGELLKDVACAYSPLTIATQTRTLHRRATTIESESVTLDKRLETIKARQAGLLEKMTDTRDREAKVVSDRIETERIALREKLEAAQTRLQEIRTGGKTHHDPHRHCSASQEEPETNNAIIRRLLREKAALKQAFDEAVRQAKHEEAQHQHFMMKHNESTLYPHKKGVSFA